MTTFKEAIDLVKLLDIESVAKSHEHAFEIIVSSEQYDSVDDHYHINYWMALNSDLIPLFCVDFDGSTVLEHPLNDGGEIMAAKEFFLGMEGRLIEVQKRFKMANEEKIHDLFEAARENIDVDGIG